MRSRDQLLFLWLREGESFTQISYLQGTENKNWDVTTASKIHLSLLTPCTSTSSSGSSTGLGPALPLQVSAPEPSSSLPVSVLDWATDTERGYSSTTAVFKRLPPIINVCLISAPHTAVMLSLLTPLSVFPGASQYSCQKAPFPMLMAALSSCLLFNQ